MTDIQQRLAELKRERGFTAAFGNSQRVKAIDAEIAKLRAGGGKADRPAGVETADQDHSRTETAGGGAKGGRKAAARKRAARKSDD